MELFLLKSRCNSGAKVYHRNDKPQDASRKLQVGPEKQEGFWGAILAKVFQKNSIFT
jgi:hypothetical protein